MLGGRFTSLAQSVTTPAKSVTAIEAKDRDGGFIASNKAKLTTTHRMRRARDSKLSKIDAQASNSIPWQLGNDRRGFVVDDVVHRNAEEAVVINTSVQIPCGDIDASSFAVVEDHHVARDVEFIAGSRSGTELNSRQHRGGPICEA